MIVTAILVGGTSTRFSINKLLYPLWGKPLTKHIIDNLSPCKSILKIVLVASPHNVSMFEGLGVDVITDNLCIGPMGGIYTSLRLFNRVFVVGGDMPNVSCGYIEKMLNLCLDNTYACIPTWSSGYMEPLAAIYTQRLLPVLEHSISIGEYSIQRLIKGLKIDVQKINIEKDLKNFTHVFNNINSWNDIHRLMVNTYYLSQHLTPLLQIEYGNT